MTVPARADALRSARRWAVGALAAALAAGAPHAAPPDGPDRVLTELSESIAQRTAAAAAEPGVLALAVAAPGAEGVRSPLQTALAAALARRGFTVAPLPPSARSAQERAAVDGRADHLLRVHVALAGGELVATGELVPTRPNFFLQGRPDARPGGAALLSASAPVTPALRALAGSGVARRFVAQPLSDLPDRVLALAAGETERGRVRIVAVTPERVLLLAPTGEILAARPVPPLPPGPRVRDAAAVAAIGAFEGGRIAYAVAGRGGEVLAAEEEGLRSAAPLPGSRGERDRAGAASPPVIAFPVAAGGAGAVWGAFTPGCGTLLDELSRSAILPRGETGSGSLVAVAAAPRPGRVAFAALTDRGTLRLLGADLAPAAPEVVRVGAGFALADLDGDGEPEVVASSPAAPGPPDAVRVLRPGAGEPPFTSGPIDGAVLAGAAADLTGDGLDDAVLAAVLPAGGTRLWIVTTDETRAP